MRRLLVFVMLLLLAGTASAGAAKRAPGDGRLTIDNGRGFVSVQAVGGLVARFDTGRIVVDDPVTGDGSGVIVTGAEKVRDLGPGRLEYAGEDVHVLIKSDRFKVRITAVGIDLGAVGRGWVILDGTGFTDAGRFQLNGIVWRSMPQDGPLRVPLGALAGSLAIK